MLLEFQVTYILFDGFAGSEIPNLNNWELAVLGLHLQGVCVQTFTAKMVLPFWLKLVSLREKENFESTLCFSVACVFDRNGFHPNGHWQDSGTYASGCSTGQSFLRNNMWQTWLPLLLTLKESLRAMRNGSQFWYPLKRLQPPLLRLLQQERWRLVRNINGRCLEEEPRIRVLRHWDHSICLLWQSGESLYGNEAPHIVGHQRPGVGEDRSTPQCPQCFTDWPVFGIPTLHQPVALLGVVFFLVSIYIRCGAARWGRVGHKGSPLHTHTHRMFFFWTGLWTPDTSVLEPELWHTVTDSKRWLAFTGWPFSWCMQTYLLEKMLQTIRALYWRNSVDIMLRIVNFKSLAKWSSIVQFGSSRCYESEGFLKLFGRKPQHLLGGRCHLRAEHLHPVRRHTDHWGFVVRDRRHGAPLSAFWRV